MAEPSDPLRPATLDDHFSLARHEDDEGFDALTIETVERWKESELSGDEYRFSYLTVLWRKGYVVRYASTGKMEWATRRVPSLEAFPLSDERDERLLPFKGEWWDDERGEDLCAQPGCAEVSVVEYRRKKDWCHRCGNARDRPYPGWDSRRRFCVRHLGRGDCGLDDADANYVAVRTRPGEGPWGIITPVEVESAEWSEWKHRLRNLILGTA